MKIGVPKETMPGERRVALVPETAQRLIKQGNEVVVERGAGTEAAFVDGAYEQAGARVVDDAYDAELVVKVQKPSAQELEKLRRGQMLIAFLQPLQDPKYSQSLAEKGVTALSMDAIPRITRAQPLDALSSQATVAGYKAVLLAAAELPRFFPMLTTDTRPVVKEQVQSLGAKFLEIDLGESGAGTGGYAKELSEEAHRKEVELLSKAVKENDIVVTTAAIPGRKAPVLITADMVPNMKPGSVIVDLAAETGGNCELTEPGKTVVKHGVTIIGTTNVPSTMPYHSSQMYSRNIASLLALFLKEGKAALDMSDEVIKGTVITQDGQVVHDATKKLLVPAATPA
ncbi:MAG: NAD(P) transhydrogenase subunit alpha [Actinobacteria bacterium]|nr:NAD(P) transhydrogenase subunit alpha [Actinomycetota bacterium]